MHAAWTKAFDKAANTGGGPVGPFTTVAHHLAHRLIGSPKCRTILAQSALDLQEVCRSAAFLEHPEEFHRTDDHRVVDISKDGCARKIGPLCEKALTAYMTGRPRMAKLFLGKIPKACPNGQQLGGRCEGVPDEIACLGEELHAKAIFLTTSILETESCGNGVIDPEEQCERHTDCGGTPLDYCVGCSCFTFGCF
ncbi:MAG: hypothetical protein R3245_09695 [Kiloniellales bacterium]|nr:hypothetical protein [Kiloniellales bacterium]